MMKYYIGYYNKPWDKSEFTVIAGSPDPFVALFILDSYREKCPESMKSAYEMISEDEAMNLKLTF